MKFNWDNFTETDFADYCAKMENNMMHLDDYVGCVRVGDLCFDLRVGCDDNILVLGCYLYVGGVDTGYSDSEYPYDYYGGFDFSDSCVAMTYDDFTAYVEKMFEQFIVEEDQVYKCASLIDKANEELKVW